MTELNCDVLLEEDEHTWPWFSALLSSVASCACSGTSSPIFHYWSSRLQLMRLPRGQLRLQLRPQAKESREAHAGITWGWRFL